LTFGASWFLGSWLLGALYDVNMNTMIFISVGAQLISIPIFFQTYRSSHKK